MSGEGAIKETSFVLPLVAILIPALAAVLTAAIGDRRERLRNLLNFLLALGTFGAVLAIALKVFGGNPLYLEFGEVANGFSLKLRVDAMAAFFSLVASILWVAALAHASSYMFHEEKRTRFFSFMMITEAATLGVFLVHDFFSLFIFLELMGLAGYFLVVHSETEQARNAASKYLYMTIIGGLSLLMGILQYFGYSGTVDFIPHEGSAFLTPPLKVAALIFMIAGFGVKAGMVPLHVWLPDAHPVAPSPASALLSGIMIKAGAYGILRTLTSFLYLRASGEGGSVGSQLAHAEAQLPLDILSQGVRQLGFALIWIAIATMFIGMVLAVIQDDVKRTLAYSSVSQMGFILLGVGCLAYLGEKGSLGLAGSLYHIINHAFFKACLFLVAGSILYSTHELNMFRLGGLWRKMPVSTVIWCIAAFGIMGIPLLNGFVSKTLLHHAIVESQLLASEGASSQAMWLKVAEAIFIITSGGTILYFLKMTYYTFFRSPRGENAHHLDKVKEVPKWMLGGAGALVLGIIVTGLAPNLFLNNLITPIGELFKGLDPHGVGHLKELSILSWANIKEIFLPLALGAGAFGVGVSLDLFRDTKKRFNPFRLKHPRWLSFDYCYVAAAKGFILICYLGQKVYEEARLSIINAAKKGILNLQESIRDKLAPKVEACSRDIALGTLAIAISLAFLLVLRILG